MARTKPAPAAHAADSAAHGAPPPAQAPGPDRRPAAGPDPAANDEAAGCAQVIGQAAEAAGQALAAGNLPAALAAMDEAHQQATQARRVLRAATSGKRGPATRPGGLRELVEQHLRG